MEEQEIINRISAEYPDAILDISGADCSFEVYVISEGFEGMRSLPRQQSILALFKPELTTGKLHALSLTCKTPAELAQSQGAGLVQLKL
ncbi:MAG: BolA family protein [Gammaproteobacteria bacterium]|nr:BolA family protein [Gammaproteobacteria bacterium]